MKVTDVYVLKDKDEKLEAALADVASIEPDFESALLTAAEAETDYAVAYSKAYLAADGSIQAREAAATIATERYLRAMNDAKAVKKFLEVKLKDRQDAVSARQSLLSAEVKTNRAF